MIDHIVLDVEIVRTVESLPRGWADTHLMGVSCAVVYEHRGDRFRVYDHSRILELQERVAAADRVTTFNGWRFDLPVIWQQPNGAPVEFLRATSDDLLARVKSAVATGALGASSKGWKLEQIADATLGRRKIDQGANAPHLYAAGRYGDLITYCIDDVALTRDLAAFADRFGYLLSTANPNARLQIPPWDSELHPNPWRVGPEPIWAWGVAKFTGKEKPA